MFSSWTVYHARGVVLVWRRNGRRHRGLRPHKAISPGPRSCRAVHTPNRRHGPAGLHNGAFDCGMRILFAERRGQDMGNERRPTD
jgi:hypothetical protein